MTDDADYSRSKLFFGLILIVVGCAYSLDELGYMDATELWSFAPLILVGIGLKKLLDPVCRTGGVIGSVLIFLGFFLLAGNFGWIEWGLWDLFPLLPFALGLRLVLGPPRRKSLDNFHTISSFIMMGGLVRGNNSAHFRGGDLVAFMGGAELDLREARITEGPAVIDAFAFWGGIEVKVPPDWIVRVEGIPLLGAFEDETRRPAADAEIVADRQELIVKGFAIMGGVGVKS